MCVLGGGGFELRTLPHSKHFYQLSHLPRLHQSKLNSEAEIKNPCKKPNAKAYACNPSTVTWAWKPDVAWLTNLAYIVPGRREILLQTIEVGDTEGETPQDLLGPSHQRVCILTHTTFQTDNSEGEPVLKEATELAFLTDIQCKSLLFYFECIL